MAWGTLEIATGTLKMAWEILETKMGDLAPLKLTWGT